MRRIGTVSRNLWSFAFAAMAAAACGTAAGGSTPGPAATTADAGHGDVPTVDGAAPDASTSQADDAAPDTQSPAPVGCISSVTAGHHAFDCDGVHYDVEVSPACASGGCGLILDVHGLTMNGPQEDASSQLSALGAARGYVVVQPTAPASSLGPSWTPATLMNRVCAWMVPISVSAIGPRSTP
jgi:hypothetical protein